MWVMPEISADERERLINCFDSLPMCVKSIVWNNFTHSLLSTKYNLKLYEFIVLMGRQASLLERCESPIEQMMFFSLRTTCIGRSIRLQIEAQVVIPGPGWEYRVDILVSPPGGSPVVVECDGHDFHEKTKQQAARDKKRDRNLQAAGYRVLRFTGSEIWENPYKCATEVLSVVGGVL